MFKKRRAVYSRSLLYGLILSAEVVMCARSLVAQNHESSLHSLDAIYMRSADSSSTAQFVRDAVSLMLFGPLPKSVEARIVSAHLQFQGQGQGSVTEENVVAAVNLMLSNLRCSYTSKTSLLQVHAVRVGMFRDIPQLLRSPQKPPAHQLVGPDMSPSGATVLAFLIFSQKIFNPAWFGDPDATARVWLDAPVAQLSSSKRFTLVGHQPPVPPASYVLIERLDTGLKDESSAETAQMHQMMDALGLTR